MTLTKGTEYPRFSWRFVHPYFSPDISHVLQKSISRAYCCFAHILNKFNRFFGIYTLYLLISVYIGMFLVIKKKNYIKKIKDIQIG